MGYYTRFTFTVEPASLTDSVLEMIKEISGYSFDETHKWYDCEYHMQQISRRFPSAVITVRGEGEDAGDLWQMYCIDGRTERVKAVISYPPMTITRPVLQAFAVTLIVAGHEITVTVEAREGTDNDELRRLAIAQIKADLEAR